MKFVSTRAGAPAAPFSEALTTSLAPDGGLYVPERFPRFAVHDFDGLTTLPRIAAKFLSPFLEGDPLQAQLTPICARAFDFPMPLRALKDKTALLELFHGPTAAFKDFGARFLAECLAAIPSPATRTVLVATSGDTGGAVAAAFHRKPGIEVLILFPKGKVSKRQEKQLTAWGDNVRAFAMRGSFDDCQRIVKEAFARRGTTLGGRTLLSANSISIGRLLPQAAYYAAASLEYLRRFGSEPGVIIPSGNLGNSMGAFWAKTCGLPIRHVVLATNANRPVPEFFATGAWAPQPTVTTLANAMDVGDPSNFERLRHLYVDLARLRSDASAVSVTDEQIKATIAAGPQAWGEGFCPHTATAMYAREHAVAGPHWIAVATAHPAKFEDIVEPLIGRGVPVPPRLAAILSRPSQATELDARLEALESAL